MGKSYYLKVFGRKKTKCNKFFLFYNLPLNNVHIEDIQVDHTLFSRQYIGQMVGKVVKIDGVVKKFIINSQTISGDERNSLRDKKVADKKLRHLLTIITDHCNRDDLQAFKTFIDILGETNNVNIAQQLSLIYNERVRSSHLIYKLRVRTDLIYISRYSHSKITWQRDKYKKYKHIFTVFRLLTDFVCLYNYEFLLSLCKIARSSVILLLPLFTTVSERK